MFSLARALGGIPVLATLEGTPAARAGVRWGDILLEVNGVPTRTWADYLEAKDLRKDGMAIVLFRNGVVTALDLVFDLQAAPFDVVRALEVIEKTNFGASAEPSSRTPSS